MAGIVAIKNGVAVRSFHTIKLDRLQLQPGEHVSWVEIFEAFDSSSWGFRDHVIRYGDAVANIHVRNSQKRHGHEVFVQIEGSPESVGVLAEEVLKMMGGKVVEFRPVRSWLARIADAWREWQEEVRAGMSVS